MTETLDQLKERSQSSRNEYRTNKLKKRVSWYFSPFYLPKDEQSFVNHMTVEMLTLAFESGQHEWALELVGTLCNLKRFGRGGDEGGRIGPAHQAAVDEIYEWFIKAQAFDALTGKKQ